MPSRHFIKNKKLHANMVTLHTEGSMIYCVKALLVLEINESIVKRTLRKLRNYDVISFLWNNHLYLHFFYTLHSKAIKQFVCVDSRCWTAPHLSLSLLKLLHIKVTAENREGRNFISTHIYQAPESKPQKLLSALQNQSSLIYPLENGKSLCFATACSAEKYH